MRKLKNEELGRKSIAAFKAAPKLPLTVILDNIRSLNNVGAVFRTADAFRVKEIILCGITATPPHRDIQKTALGATESVAWRYEKNTLQAVTSLQEEGVHVWAVEQAEGAQQLHHFSPQNNIQYAVILGHEVKGVAQAVVDAANGVLEIPQEGTKHSLNVSVAAGVVLWDFFQKFKVT